MHIYILFRNSDYGSNEGLCCFSFIKRIHQSMHRMEAPWSWHPHGMYSHQSYRHLIKVSVLNSQAQCVAPLHDLTGLNALVMPRPTPQHQVHTCSLPFILPCCSTKTFTCKWSFVSSWNLTQVVFLWWMLWLTPTSVPIFDHIKEMVLLFSTSA